MKCSEKKIQKQTERERYKAQLSSSKILKTKSIFDNVYNNNNILYDINYDYNSNYDDYTCNTHRSKSSSNRTYKYISKYINNIENNNTNNEKYKMLSSSQSLRNLHNNDNNEYMNQLKKDLYFYEQSKINKTKTMIIDDRIFYRSNVEVCPPNAMDAERFEFFKG